MATPRTPRSTRKGAADAASKPGEAERRPASPDSGGGLNPIPELMRRLLGVGFSGFFMGEEALRKALGDTLPKDWSDFAVQQSERTRQEFLERLSFEIGRSLENLDLAAAPTSLLEGRTLEVKAQIRLGERGSGASGRKLDISVLPESESP